MTKNLGVIAEDQSDLDVVHLALQKIASKPFKLQKFLGRGCGKIAGKSRSWAENLMQRGCGLLVLVQDSDENDPVTLKSDLEAAVGQRQGQHHVVVVAVREVEAWLLADHAAITAAFGLKQPIGKIANPEAILRPKEFLRNLVYQRSGKRVRYINTVHNKMIAAKASVTSLHRCASFVSLEQFARRHL